VLTYALVVIVYLHLSPEERQPVYAGAGAAVAPGGRLLIVGHDRLNATEGEGGPPDPTRLLSAEEIGREFYLRRLRAAEAHRRRVVSDSEAYRVVHAEADLLPGLIIDRYGDCFVIQTLSAGMEKFKSSVVEILQKEFSPRSILERNDAAVRNL